MKSTRVFLGNAPWRKPGYYGVRAGSRWPHYEAEDMEYMPFPFFLAYAAAVVEGEGFPVLLVDAVAEDIDDDGFVAKIRDFKPDLIVLEISTASIDADLKILARVRSELSRAKIALAGLHQEMYEPPFLKQHKDADIILVGEYEFSLLDVAKALECGGKVAGISGVIARNDEDVVDGGRRPLETDLSRFPWPARHFLPMNNYHDEPGSIPRPSAQMWASRGCPFDCTFCAWPQIMYDSRKYRARPVVDVVDEMEWLVKEGGFSSVYFDDDTFNVGKARMLDFAREVKFRCLDIPFAVMARADLMDREILEALKDAGLYALKYGVESAEQKLLDQCAKGLDIEKVKETVRITHELDIKMHLTFMFGMPGETRETAKKTIDLALEMAPESVQFTVATPFPGSKYWREMIESGKLMSRDYNRYDGFRSAVVKTDSLSSKQLESILGEANRRWHEHRASRLA